MAWADAVEIEAQVGVTDTAAGDFDDDLVCLRVLEVEIDPGKRFAGFFNNPTLGAH